MFRLLPLLIAALLMTIGLSAVADAPAFVPGSWTLVIMPDVQNYQGANAGVFTSQTQWIRNNAQTRNIKYVLQEGDLTNNNYASQWDWVRTSMSLLDGVVPYAMVPGNHDCLDSSGKMSNRVSLLSTYFLSRAQSMSTFGGTYEPNNLNNSYHLFSAGGYDWIVIALEWAPRDAVLTWANGLLTTHSNRSAMIVTHAYLYSDNTRYDWPTKGTSQSWNPNAYNTSGVMTGGVNDGEQIWQKVAKLHENVKFVFNGHVLNDGVGLMISEGDHGNPVYQMLANYQAPIQPNHGGDGYLRLLEFRPDGETVQVYTYSPYLNTCLTDDQQQFVLSTVIPPASPTNPGTTNIAPTSIRFTWQDNSDDETGYKVYYDPGSGTPVTLQATTPANATYYDAVGLSSNAPYSFQVLATRDGDDSFKTTRITAFTLSGPPSVGNNVVCNKNTSQPYPVGTSFTFSNPAGFGLNGPYKVTMFRCVWDKSPTHTWSGSESLYWTYGTLSQTGATAGDYYLHLQANNAMPGLPNPTTLDYGPFRVDGTSPITSPAPVSGVYVGAVSVSLTPNEPAVIYYTTDGSEPTSSSAIYSEPIHLTSDCTLKYYAVDEAGNAESPKKTQTYWVLSGNGSIAEVKDLTADGAVRLGNKNLHRKSGSFGYIEEPDRASGIRIEGNITADEGSVVSLVGRLQRPVGSECYVLLDAITSSGPVEIRPLGMNDTALSSQLATGLCVKTWGIVKPGSVTSDSFMLIDGSMSAGVKVITNEAPGVIGGQFVIVTGAMGFDGATVIYANRVEGI